MGAAEVLEYSPSIGELLGLGVRHLTRMQVAGREDLQHRHHEAEDDRESGRAPREVVFAVLPQQVRRDAGHEEAAGDQRRVHRMEEAGQRGRIEHRRPEVHQLGAAVPQDVARGGLLPGVGDQDPERRDGGPDRHHQDREPVRPLRHAVAAEEVQAQEAGLEEEREHALGGQRRAEDVPDELRVLGPVGAELELHHDAGCDPDREGQGEQLPEELPHPHPGGVARPPAPPLDGDQ